MKAIANNEAMAIRARINSDNVARAIRSNQIGDDNILCRAEQNQSADSAACYCLLSVCLCLEAHRALELLEDYHAKLTRPQDKQLRLAIERVIRIFKSRLFQALLGESHFFFLFLSSNFLPLFPSKVTRAAAPTARRDGEKVARSMPATFIKGQEHLVG